MADPSRAEKNGRAQTDAAVVRAMDRVLQHEREAERSLAECARQCDQLVERSREQGRLILERARTRIIALHARAARALEQSTTKLIEQHRQAVLAAAKELSSPGPGRAALQRLAARLTGGATERNGDDN